MSACAPSMSEAIETFACFGASATVVVQGSGPAGSAPEATARAKRRLLDWHVQFSRFDPTSELSQLNGDPRERVPVTFYARKRIGIARWKVIHRFTALAWLMALVHTFAQGSDAGKLWFTALIGLTAAPVLGLLVFRHGRRSVPTHPLVVAAGSGSQ